MSWERARAAHRCQVRDLLPSASLTVLQFAGFGGDAVPNTQLCSKLPTVHFACPLSFPQARSIGCILFTLFPAVWSWLQQGLLPGPAVHSALCPFCSCSSPFVCSQSSPFHMLMVKPMSSLPSASVVAGIEGYFVQFNLLQREDGRFGENDP